MKVYCTRDDTIDAWRGIWVREPELKALTWRHEDVDTVMMHDEDGDFYSAILDEIFPEDVERGQCVVCGLPRAVVALKGA